MVSTNKILGIYLKFIDLLQLLNRKKNNFYNKQKQIKKENKFKTLGEEEMFILLAK